MQTTRKLCVKSVLWIRDRKKDVKCGTQFGTQKGAERAFEASGPIVRETSRPSENIRSCRWLSRVFGCWHTKLSRPFSSQSQTYPVRLACGARRQFNPRTLEMQGKFYYNLPKRAHSIKAI